MNIHNNRGIEYSLQISNLEDVTPQEDFNLGGKYFLIKNVTDNDIEVTVTLVGSPKQITTILYPGWNPEICTSIIAPESGLQIGY